ncbi:MAG TPA: hypothetical protein VMC09_03800 [Anaerolineales bacterium]|nr:hypothetical protein [Anaerolineales bacterium]
MQKTQTLVNRCLVIPFALALLIAGSGCSPVQSTPMLQTRVVTQVVTRFVTQDVTQEVTRVIGVPVTVTPGPTPTPTSTPDPSTPSSSGLPLATLPQYTDCLHGPATYFTYKTSFPAGQQVEVVGRSEDSSWIDIEEVGDWNSCWIQAGQAQLESGQVEDLPTVTTMLPKSEYEFGSPSANAKRAGDVVTVSWKAVYMSADEVQGYLIDAYVCQGGQLVHLPVFVSETYAKNTGTISVQIKDEAGCAGPSTAHIVSVGRRGFAEWEKIFWPAQ